MYAVGLEKDSKGPVLREMPKPFIAKDNQALVKVLYAGICGTDRNIIRWQERDLPPGEDFLTLGHEAVGVVEAVAAGVKTLHPGDIVVPTVRRGCGRCSCCLNGQSDMCCTGLYTERGIHKVHGFFTEYFVEEEQYLIKVPANLPPLLATLAEPLSISEKALGQLRTLQLRVPWLCSHTEHRYDAEKWGHCKKALVVGAGPIGFLGTMLLRQAAVQTYLVEVVGEEHIKVQLVRQMGATYIDGRGKTPEDIAQIAGSPDIILEASGASVLSLGLLPFLARNGVFIFTGIPRGKIEACVDSNFLLAQLVRSNQLIIGSINSNREHFVAALKDLVAFASTSASFLGKVISHQFSLLDYVEALQMEGPQVMKVVFNMQLIPR